MSVYCATTIGEESIGFGWGRRISNISENTVVRWDELHSGWIVGAYGKIGGYYSSTTYPSVLYHGVFASNAKYRKEILPKYRRVPAKPKWKKLSRKDGIKSRHVAWAQLLWRSFGVMGFVCQHCGCLMRLRAVAIYPPATTKILRGLGVNLHGISFTGPP